MRRRRKTGGTGSVGDLCLGKGINTAVDHLFPVENQNRVVQIISDGGPLLELRIRGEQGSIPIQQRLRLLEDGGQLLRAVRFPVAFPTGPGRDQIRVIQAVFLGDRHHTLQNIADGVGDVLVEFVAQLQL